ncbi:DUF6174 domain-containing protein [Ardenticatena maritima]|uniref:Uncharacterized protein n=3 Tax=Ardenticatena maritima TaxID=872965 RepID=A0A0P6YVA7_9CHLR|nr:DUF6174 domain-containing protein [Ardenticatena maritima]KPL87856.1 hypothetical protein SE16_09950 [Ardenticatena maritima]
MRRWLLFMLSLLMLSGCGWFDGFAPAASFDTNNAEREAWNALGITSYRLLVEVEKYNERRQVEAVVRDGRLEQAVLRYWNDEARDWEAPQVLSEERGEPYTVPGLFEMVGGQLAGQQRGVSARYDETYHFPTLIRLGNVHDQNGAVLRDTEVVVRVLEFEPLEPSP